MFGAGTMSRTRDLLITNQLLYQLSYAGLALESVEGGGLFRFRDHLTRALRTIEDMWLHRAAILAPDRIFR